MEQMSKNTKGTKCTIESYQLPPASTIDSNKKGRSEYECRSRFPRIHRRARGHRPSSRSASRRSASPRLASTRLDSTRLVDRAHPSFAIPVGGESAMAPYPRRQAHPMRSAARSDPLPRSRALPVQRRHERLMCV